jgi:hypothetical protein
MENKTTANPARAARFGQSALQGASFNVTPRDVLGIAKGIGLAEGIRFKGHRPQDRLTTRLWETPVQYFSGTNRLPCIVA